jgi:purine nucleoside permease
MDAFGTTAGAVGDAVPDQLRALFNNPDDVGVQQLPCVLPGLDSLAVHFGAGARTVPHQQHNGQHLVFVEGEGVVADEDGVHVVRAVFDQLHLKVLDRLGEQGRLDWSRASVDTMSVRAKRGGTTLAQIQSIVASLGASSTWSATGAGCRSPLR